MDIKKIKVGKNPPQDVNVIIEIPMQSDPVKYEFDKDSGAIIVDRFMKAPMYYPCNYGFVPHTLSGDGDPCDVLVIAKYPLFPGVVINCRPVGVLMMEDESGIDEKIIAVPSSKLDNSYDNVKDISDVPEEITGQIKHFFENYKTLDANKWVKVMGFENKEKAISLLQRGIENAG